MQKNKQKLLSLLLTVVMVIGLLPMTAFAADTRTPVSSVVATTATGTFPPVLGEPIKTPTFTVTGDSGAYFSDRMGSWLKFEWPDWKEATGNFTAGKWKYATQVRIDGETGANYVLAEDATVTVNGVKWITSGLVAEDGYSYLYASSPEYELEGTTTSTEYTLTVEGGTGSGSYTAGTVVSIKANVPEGKDFDKWESNGGGSFGNATSETATFTMPAGDVTVTAIFKNSRIQVSHVEATTATGTFPPVLGEPIKTPTFTVIKGFPACFSDRMGSWLKFEWPDWKEATGNFTAGNTWKYATQVRIDSAHYVLAEGATVTVNGEEWITSGLTVEYGYSYLYASSPEYTTATPLVFADSTAYDIPAGTVGESYTASTALTASGGKLPYVFTVAPAVDGLSIGSDNKLVYTRPTVADAKTATIKVTDDLGASKTITINIGAVTAAPETTYALTVTNGTDKTGGSPYAAGTAVSIEADPPAPGKQFKEWTTSNGGTFASATSASTTFTMPDKDVTVTATYKDAPVTTYAVTVNSGNGSGSTGSGSYTAGTTVNIYAGNRSGYTFTGWTSSDVTITNASNKNASFTMPAKNVTVKANWSYNSGGGGGGGSSSNTNATLSDTKAEFDKNEGDDLKVTLKSGSYSLRSIRNGSYTLEEGRDYTISGGTVTIKASYLDSLKEGKHYLTFDMNGGTDPVLTIIVTETTKTDPQEEKPAIEETVKFEDIKSGDWFYDAVNYIYNAGLMVGTSDTTFSPYTNTTRGMIVTILHTLEGSPMPNTTNGFTDVGADKYYTDAVAWASANKIVSGYGNGIFSPDNSITREQMAVILMNYAQYKGYDVSTRADLSKFADGEYISPWAKDAMSWANAEGLMQGSGNQLMPADNAQRCQVAAILQSFLERIAK